MALASVHRPTSLSIEDSHEVSPVPLPTSSPPKKREEETVNDDWFRGPYKKPDSIDAQDTPKDVHHNFLRRGDRAKHMAGAGGRSGVSAIVQGRNSS